MKKGTKLDSRPVRITSVALQCDQNSKLDVQTNLLIDKCLNFSRRLGPI